MIHVSIVVKSSRPPTHHSARQPRRGASKCTATLHTQHRYQERILNPIVRITLYMFHIYGTTNRPRCAAGVLLSIFVLAVEGLRRDTRRLTEHTGHLTLYSRSKEAYGHFRDFVTTRELVSSTGFHTLWQVALKYSPHGYPLRLCACSLQHQS